MPLIIPGLEVVVFSGGIISGLAISRHGPVDAAASGAGISVSAAVSNLGQVDLASGGESIGTAASVLTAARPGPGLRKALRGAARSTVTDNVK